MNANQLETHVAEFFASAEANYRAFQETKKRALAIMEANAAKPRYIETRTMYADQLRALCVQRNWYTCGTCAEYEKLFNRLQSEDGTLCHLSTARLAEIAQDIADHSDLDDGYDIPAIMYELARICVVCFDIKSPLSGEERQGGGVDNSPQIRRT